MLKALWAYRGFILSSISNEFVSRFARSKLGGLWAVIHPLLQVAIFALILSNLLAAKLPGIGDKDGYALYLMAGTLGWNLFSEIVLRSTTLFIDHANLMKKVRFPKITLPAIVVGSSLLNNVLLFLSILLIFRLLGHTPPLTAVWIPLLMGLMALFATGLGLLLGILNVFIRDIGQLVPVLLQVLFWFTPIVYPAQIIPPEYRDLLPMNPIFSLVSAYQQALLYGLQPDGFSLWPIVALSLPLLMLALWVFRRASPELVDVL